MALVNEMRRKILGAFQATAEAFGLDWVEVRDCEDGGCVWVQPVDGFGTILRMEYEFEGRCCRLLLFRDGGPVAGRCGIRYDDGSGIGAVLARFGELLRDGPSECEGAWLRIRGCGGGAALNGSALNGSGLRWGRLLGGRD